VAETLTWKKTKELKLIKVQTENITYQKVIILLS